MSLSIGVQKGFRIKIGDEVIRAIEIDYGRSVMMIEVGPRTHRITDDAKVEILPSVFVRYGKNRDRLDVMATRLAFDAPRHVKISRCD